MGFADFFAGLALTAESKIPEAIRKFEQSFVCFQNIQQNIYTIALMGLGLAYIKRGQVELARLHLLANLKESRRKQAHLPLILSVPALVLLFAMQAKLDLASQVYELGMANPMLQRSCWLRDLIGGTLQIGTRCQDGESRRDFWGMMSEAQRALEE
jgi:hypothetical protein